MFYYNYVSLCNKLGKSPSAVAEDMGYQRSVVTRWSKGTVPRRATLQKIADYFGVQVSDLTKEKENPAKHTGGAESELDAKLIEKILSFDLETKKAWLQIMESGKF